MNRKLKLYRYAICNINCLNRTKQVTQFLRYFISSGLVKNRFLKCLQILICNHGKNIIKTMRLIFGMKAIY